MGDTQVDYHQEVIGNLRRVGQNLWQETIGETTLFHLRHRKSERDSATFTILVDTEDADRILSYGSIHLREAPNGFYAALQSRGPTGNQEVISIQRFVMKPKPGEIVDHAYGNTLDNRKRYLRNTTETGDHANRHMVRTSNRSGRTGVKKLAGKWAATFCFKGLDYHFGYFDDVDQAAEAHVIGREKVRTGEVGPTSLFASGMKRIKSAGCDQPMRERIRRLTIFDPEPTAEELAQSMCKAGIRTSVSGK
jgi:hypothetical protein